MKRLIYSLVILALFAAAQIAGANARAYRGREPQQGPEITAARVKGKKIVVTGVNFSQAAVIYVEGQPVATRSDPDSPSLILIAKKGGKHIPPETIASISVQNDTGAMSQPFQVFSGLVITYDDNVATFGLSLGEKFQLLLLKANYQWSAPLFDPKVIARVPDDQLLPGAQGVFQAIGEGASKFTSFGDLPCLYNSPPCLLPSLSFGVTLEVK